MGGGGGGPIQWPSNEDAEKKAREIIDEARGRRNLFISFAHEDLNDVNLFRASKANEKSDIEFVDRSVRKPYDSENDPYIRQQITQRIRQASMTAVYLTNNSASSKWVDWEISQSIKLGKKVVAFHSGDTPPSKLPKAVSDHGIKVVPWKKISEEL